MSNPLSVWDTLGKQDKLALAKRDDHAMRRLLKRSDGEWKYDATLINKILEQADKYYDWWRRKKL
jgi:hypothetical protein